MKKQYRYLLLNERGNLNLTKVNFKKLHDSDGCTLYKVKPTDFYTFLNDNDVEVDDLGALISYEVNTKEIWGHVFKTIPLLPAIKRSQL